MTTKFILLTYLTLLLTACGYPMGLLGVVKEGGTQDLTSSTVLMDPSKEAAALSVLARNCSGCHGDTSGSANVYGLANVNHMVSTGLIVPGAPDSSLIYQVISQGVMPPGGPLTATDQEIIRSWIAGGGPSVPPPNPNPGGGTNPPPTPTPNPSPNPPPSAAPTFTYIRANILNKCIGCHSAKSATAGYAFDTYTGAKKAVNLTTPNRSLLYTITQKGSMPPSPAAALTSDQTNLILTWIEKGALNN